MSQKTIPFPHKQYGMYYIEEDLRDAAYRGDVERITNLLSYYPQLNLNAVNEYNETALYIAAKRNQDKTVDFLLKQPGVDPKISTILGNDCLLIAAWNDNTALAEKLVKHGANIHARTNASRKYHGNVSALDIANERNNQELVEFLNSFSPSPTPSTPCL